MKTASTLFICTLIGCATPQSGKPVNQIPRVVEGLEVAVAIGKTLVAAHKNVPGCYVVASLGTVVNSIKDIPKFDYSAAISLPRIELDVSQCNTLLNQEAQPKTVITEQTAVLLRDILPPVSKFIRGIVFDTNLPCKNKLIAEAVLGYLNNIVPAVTAELQDPDGILIVEGVTIPNTCQ